MAKSKAALERKKQRQLRHKRRRARKQSQREHRQQVARAKRSAEDVPPRLALDLEEAELMVEDGEFDDAEELLKRLYRTSHGHPAVIEAQMALYETVGDHEKCCQTAKELMHLRPNHPRAVSLYAAKSLLCGRYAIALGYFRLLAQRWPDYARVVKLGSTIAELEREHVELGQQLGWGDDTLELLLLRDTSMECVAWKDFEAAAETLLQMLALKPDLIPMRHNLAWVYVRLGQSDKAIEVADDICQRAPDDHFSQITRAKVAFFTGNHEKANTIADALLSDVRAAIRAGDGVESTSPEQAARAESSSEPPDNLPSKLADTIGILSILGRDRDILQLEQAAEDCDLADGLQEEAKALHQLAVAHYRIGNTEAAWSLWNVCLKLKKLVIAQENLEDLNQGIGHAPWAESMVTWLPQAVGDSFQDALLRGVDFNLAQRWPAGAELIPALLERGDPDGRELAFNLAILDASLNHSPAMLDALAHFALGKRGPDDLRYRALRLVCEEGHISKGPHRFFSDGLWREVSVCVAEIDWQPEPSPSWKRELLAIGNNATSRGDFELAEASYNKILERDPDTCGAVYNLCTVWAQRDGKAGQRRARARIEELHQAFPDYIFASVLRAQLVALEGDFARADAMLQPVIAAEKLHFMEARALFMAQVQIALKRHRLSAARWALFRLGELSDKDDSQWEALHRLVESAAREGQSA